jgi:hypothetical protein
VRVDVREGDIGMQLGEIAKANPEVAIGSRSSIRSTGPTRMWCCALAMHRSSRGAKRAVQDMLERVRRAK